MSKSGQPPVEWKLWYQDLFDRESPRQIEASGTNLLEGLIELWKRHLQETVQAEGQKGFARFNLWIVEDEVSVEIRGSWEGQRKLRSWLVENPDQAPARLKELAAHHLRLLVSGETCRPLLTRAAECASWQAFEDAQPESN
jgi:hypothetical protein